MEEENDIKDVKVVFRGRNNGISIALTVRIHPVKYLVNRNIILTSPENEVVNQKFVIRDISTSFPIENNIYNVKFAFSPNEYSLVQWSEPKVFL